MSLEDDPSFALAVEEEMRRMEEEFRRQLSPEAFVGSPPRVTAAPALAPGDEEQRDRYEERNNINFDNKRDFDAYGQPAVRPVDPQFAVVVTNHGLFDASPELQKSSLGSPVRRKGGAISTMYGPSDDRTNTKAAKKAEYAILLKKQIDEKRVMADEQRARDAFEEEAALLSAQKNQAPPPRKPKADLFHQSPGGGGPAVRGVEDRPAVVARVPEPYSYPSFDAAPPPKSYIKMNEYPQPQTLDRQRHPPPSVSDPRNGPDPESARYVNTAMKATESITRPAISGPFAQTDMNPMDIAAVEKQAKRTKQEEYRMFLEQQMNEDNKRKRLETKMLKDSTLDSPPRAKDPPKHGAQQLTRGDDDNYYNDTAPGRPDAPQLHSIQTHYESLSPAAAGSPGKGLEGVHHTKVVARTKLLKDVYGSENIFPMGSPTGAAIPGGGDDSPFSKKITVDERSIRDKRANYNEYKAALDMQMKEKQQQKKRELEELKLLEQKENERLQAEIEKAVLAKRQEAERQRAMQTQNDIDILIKQENIAQERAKKRVTKPSADPSPPRGEPDVTGGETGTDVRDAQEYPHQRSPDRRRQASVRAQDLEYGEDFVQKPMTPPRFSKVSVDPRQFDLRRLTEETFMGEREATPGGALQCDSHLIPVSEPLQGYPPRHHVGRSYAQEDIYRDGHRYRGGIGKPKYAAAPYHHHRRHVVAREAREYEDDEVGDAYDSSLYAAIPEQSMRGYSVRSRNLGGIPPAGPKYSEPNPWDKELGMLSALGDPASGYDDPITDAIMPSTGTSTPPRRSKPFEFDNVTERSLASDSYLAYLTNRRPMTQERGHAMAEGPPSRSRISAHGSAGAVSLASVSEHSSISNDDHPSEDVVVPILPNRPRPHLNQIGFELEKQNRSLQYDNLNKLLRSSEERLSRDLLALDEPAHGGRAPSEVEDEPEEIRVVPQKPRSFWNRP
jgi:hypothetical protein